MHTADIVFIQQDTDIVRDNFNKYSERNTLEELRENFFCQHVDVIYFDNYLEPYINGLVKHNAL